VILVAREAILNIKDSDQEPAHIDSPTDFGATLNAYRRAAGIRQRDLGNMLGWSHSLISMIERGERAASEDFARKADTVLKAENALISAWQTAAEQAARLPSWFLKWVEVERSARLLRTWQPLIVPGLLQTENYARAIFSGAPGITSDQVADNATARIARQHILHGKDAPMLRVVLDEGVLLRPIGSEAVMAEQMLYLMAMSEKPNITVQVLPLRAWLTTGLQGAFILADGPAIAPMAYMEAATQSHITAEPNRVAAVATRFDAINGDALSRHASQNLIREAAQQWK